MYVCMYIYIYSMYIHIYIYIYIHMHTYINIIVIVIVIAQVHPGGPHEEPVVVRGRQGVPDGHLLSQSYSRVRR